MECVHRTCCVVFFVSTRQGAVYENDLCWWYPIVMTLATAHLLTMHVGTWRMVAMNPQKPLVLQEMKRLIIKESISVLIGQAGR